MVQSNQGIAEGAAAPAQAGEASVVVVDSGAGAVKATARTDAMMALLLVALAAFGVVTMALYVVQLALKRGKDQ